MTRNFGGNEADRDAFNRTELRRSPRGAIFHRLPAAVCAEQFLDANYRELISTRRNPRCSTAEFVEFARNSSIQDKQSPIPDRVPAITGALGVHSSRKPQESNRRKLPRWSWRRLPLPFAFAAIGAASLTSIYVSGLFRDFVLSRK